MQKGFFYANEFLKTSEAVFKGIRMDKKNSRCASSGRVLIPFTGQEGKPKVIPERYSAFLKRSIKTPMREQRYGFDSIHGSGGKAESNLKSPQFFGQF